MVQVVRAESDLGMPGSGTLMRPWAALAARVADGYAEAGFTVVLQDIIVGSHLTDMVSAIQSRPRYVVALAPSARAVQARDRARQLARGKVAYKHGDEPVADLDAYFRRETPRIGLWIDTSDQTADETVDAVLARIWTEGGSVQAA